MRIVLTGSIGKISKPLAENLIKAGHDVSIISSSNEKRVAIEGMGAKALIGNILEPEFLQHSFQGSDAVYCMVPPDYAAPDQLGYYRSVGKAYFDAIKETGVKRVVHLSSFGAHLSEGNGLIKGSHQVENMLNTLPDISLTHMRPGYFFYNLLSFIPMIKAAGFIGSVYGGPDTLPLVAPRDIAEAIAEQLQIQTDAAPVRYVYSDDRSCNEVATLIGNAIGIPELKWTVLSADQVGQSLASNGMPETLIKGLIEMGESIHTGKLREEFDKESAFKGTMTMERYAEIFADHYFDKTVG